MIYKARIRETVTRTRTVWVEADTSADASGEVMLGNVLASVTEDEEATHVEGLLDLVPSHMPEDAARLLELKAGLLKSIGYLDAIWTRLSFIQSHPLVGTLGLAAIAVTKLTNLLDNAARAMDPPKEDGA